VLLVHFEQFIGQNLVRILYTVQSSFLFVYLLLLPYLLYLGCGLNDIPYSLNSCCSLSFVIFLQVMIPCLHCCTITTGQQMEYIFLCNLFAEVCNIQTDAGTSAHHQPSVQFESKHAAATCTIKKTVPVGVVPHNSRTNIICALRNHSCMRIIDVWLEVGEGKFNPNTYVNPFLSTNLIVSSPHFWDMRTTLLSATPLNELRTDLKRTVMDS
jgi:hypothetical protein